MTVAPHGKGQKVKGQGHTVTRYKKTSAAVAAGAVVLYCYMS